MDIDIVGTSRDKSLLLGECKWTNKPVDKPLLDSLLDRSRLLPYKTLAYYLFSKTGFTDRCRVAAAEIGNVTLISLSEMVATLSGAAGSAALYSDHS